MTVGGAAALAVLLLAGPGGRPPAFLAVVLVGFILAGEALPITLVRAGRTAELTPSTTFAFAALLLIGPAFAVLALAGGVIVVDLVRRRPVEMVLANLGQATLALALAGLVHGALPGPSPPLTTPGELIAALPATAAAAVVFVLVTHGLSAVVMVLRGAPLRPLLTEDFFRHAGWSAVLISPAPLVAAVGMASATLLPLLLVPMAAMHRSASVLMERDHRALHDTLTGLPNRDLFDDRARQAIAAAQRRGETCAVLIVDLDHFKQVNDTLGHPVGDRLLAGIAQRLAAQARGADTVARIGGDEFGVVLAPPVSAVDAQLVASRIRRTVAAPVELDDLPLRVEASVGIALHPAHGEDAPTLIARADAAMYQAKASRQGTATFVATHGAEDDRMVMLERLRSAVEEGALAVWYQPQHEVTSGEIVAVEALLRWPSPGDWTPPSQFIPAAEQTGLMRGVTRYVLEHALAQQRRWHDAGWRGRLAVNVSLRDLEDPAFPGDVVEMLTRHGVPPSTLELEISETSIATEPARVADALAALRDTGADVAIDNFGTGATSLSLLRTLPVNSLKIDRTFLADPTNTTDLAIVASAIALGQKLGLRAVAEGVEHESSLEQLRDLECGFAQGFFLSRPMPADRVTASLTDGDGSAPASPQA